MKKTLMYCALALASSSACNEKAKQLEREYAVLFEKEYTALESSERYKTFLERYRLLTDLSKEVDETEEIIIPELQKTDTLCFIPPKERDLQIDKQVDAKMAGKTGALPFSEYVNLSKEVNATIVGESFYKNTPSATTFRDEKDLHTIRNIADKTGYMEARLLDTAQLYDAFCEDRILMDRVNNSRYFLILKDVDRKTAEYDEKSGNDEFSSGLYVGIVYIYDIQEKKFINQLTIGGTNSDTVEGYKKSIGFSLNSDLNTNIDEALEKDLTEKFGLRGKLPYIHIPIH